MPSFNIPENHDTILEVFLNFCFSPAGRRFESSEAMFDWFDKKGIPMDPRKFKFAPDPPGKEKTDAPNNKEKPQNEIAQNKNNHKKSQEDSGKKQKPVKTQGNSDGHKIENSLNDDILMTGDRLPPGFKRVARLRKTGIYAATGHYDYYIYRYLLFKITSSEC